jgi:hypothetical protein
VVSASGPGQLWSVRPARWALEPERRREPPVVLQWRRHRKDWSTSHRGRQMPGVRVARSADKQKTPIAPDPEGPCSTCLTGDALEEGNAASPP